jgi:hypothetical protein
MVKNWFSFGLLGALLLLSTLSLAQYPQGDYGQYLILNAQYGTPAHHIDVTNRLKELARQDRTFRMGNSTFGTDPDPGHVKQLRIFARGPNGQERTFDYPENSVVDGAMFRAWGSGEWGNPGPGWRPVWGEPGGYENQPEMQAALQSLRDAQRNLETASHDKGGYRAKALDLVRQAIADVENGMQYDNTHR